MVTVHKKIVVDKNGKPTEDLKQARRDREKGKKDAYVELDSI